MQRILSLLCAFCLLGASASAQSTMPAMGVNTPKGQVAKTDASINQAAADTSGRRTMKSGSTRVRKTKTTKTKSTSTM